VGGFAVLAQARFHQLRWPGGPDRHDAHRTGGAATLDQRAPLSACAQLHHGAAGPRGPAARDLHRLVDARHSRRDHCRGAVRAAVAGRPDRTDLDLSGFWRRASGGGCALRNQAGGDRYRGLRRLPHRLPRAAQPRALDCSGGVFRRHLRAAGTLSLYRVDGGGRRVYWRALGTGQVQGGRRSPGI